MSLAVMSGTHERWARSVDDAEVEGKGEAGGRGLWVAVRGSCVLIVVVFLVRLLLLSMISVMQCYSIVV